MKAAVFMLVFAVTAYGFTVKDREKVCTSNSRAKCLWLNDYISKKHALPFYSTLELHSKLLVVCYEGTLTLDTFIHLWDYLEVSLLTSEPNNLMVLLGNSSHSILSESPQHHNASKTLHLSPFGVHCIGVKHALETINDVRFGVDANLEVWVFYPIFLTVGLTLLYLAPVMSRNVPLIYSTGVTIGILASVIVLIFLMSRYLPGKNFVGLGFLAGGYTVIGSVAFWFLNNILDVCRDHMDYVIGYAVITGLISFAIIYRWGGVSDPRTFDLIQWSMQLLGVCVIYFSTPLMETSIAMIIISLTLYFIPLNYNPLLLPFWLVWWLLRCVLAPFSYCLRCLSLWKKSNLIIPKQRYLTSKEYEEQGTVETEKALEDLRHYCKNKKGAIKMIAKLQDSERFAGFLSGVDHVSPEERVNHEWSIVDDSDLDDDNGEEISGSSYQYTPPSHYTPLQPSPPSPSPRGYSPPSYKEDSRYFTAPAARSHDSSGHHSRHSYSSSPSRHKH